MGNRFECTDCFPELARMPDASVDMAIIDYPYEITRNTWDTPGVFDQKRCLSETQRVLKPGKPLFIFCKHPLTGRISAYLDDMAWFKWEYIWAKEKGSAFFNAHRTPLPDHENILVGCSGTVPYTPQMHEGKAYRRKSLPDRLGSNYNKGCNEVLLTDNPGTRYPRTVLYYPRDLFNKGIHPTQKPLALIEYLILSHSNPGDVILDPTCGSATTVVAALKTGRGYIAFEKDEAYYDAAVNRVARFVQCGKDEWTKPPNWTKKYHKMDGFFPKKEGL